MGKMNRYNTIFKLRTDIIKAKKSHIIRSKVDYNIRNKKPVSLLKNHPCIDLQNKLGKDVWSIIMSFIYQTKPHHKFSYRNYLFHILTSYYSHAKYQFFCHLFNQESSQDKKNILFKKMIELHRIGYYAVNFRYLTTIHIAIIKKYHDFNFE